MARSPGFWLVSSHPWGVDNRLADQFCLPVYVLVYVCMASCSRATISRLCRPVFRELCLGGTVGFVLISLVPLFRPSGYRTPLSERYFLRVPRLYPGALLLSVRRLRMGTRPLPTSRLGRATPPTTCQITWGISRCDFWAAGLREAFSNPTLKPRSHFGSKVLKQPRLHPALAEWQTGLSPKKTLRECWSSRLRKKCYRRAPAAIL